MEKQRPEWTPRPERGSGDGDGSASIPRVSGQIYTYQCPGCGSVVRLVLEEAVLLFELHREDRCPICKRDIRIVEGEPRINPR